VAEKKNPFFYFYIGHLHTPIRNAAASLEAISFQEWIGAIFGDKVLQLDRCQLITKGVELEPEHWNLRIKFPFPYSAKNVSIKKYWVPVSNRKCSCVLVPSENSGSSLEMLIIFEKKNKETCDFKCYFNLIPDGNTNYSKTANIVLCKHIFAAIMRLKSVILGTNPKDISSRITEKPKGLSHSPIKTTPTHSPHTGHRIVDLSARALITPRPSRHLEQQQQNLQNPVHSERGRSHSLHQNEPDSIPQDNISSRPPVPLKRCSGSDEEHMVRDSRSIETLPVGTNLMELSRRSVSSSSAAGYKLPEIPNEEEESNPFTSTHIPRKITLSPKKRLFINALNSARRSSEPVNRHTENGQYTPRTLNDHKSMYKRKILSRRSSRTTPTTSAEKQDEHSPSLTSSQSSIEQGSEIMSDDEESVDLLTDSEDEKKKVSYFKKEISTEKTQEIK